MVLDSFHDSERDGMTRVPTHPTPTAAQHSPISVATPWILTLLKRLNSHMVRPPNPNLVFVPRGYWAQKSIFFLQQVAQCFHRPTTVESKMC